MNRLADGADGRFEKYRAYLTFLAREALTPQLNAKIDPSGIANQTLHEATIEQKNGRGPDKSDTKQWLRHLLANNLKDEVRRFQGPTRDLTREIRIETALEETCRRLDLLAEQTPPSQRAVNQEDIARMTQALAALPEKQRSVVTCIHLEGMSQSQTADLLQTTRPAVAGLLRRGLSKLRELMEDQG